MLAQTSINSGRRYKETVGRHTHARTHTKVICSGKKICETHNFPSLHLNVTDIIAYTQNQKKYSDSHTCHMVNALYTHMESTENDYE